MSEAPSEAFGPYLVYEQLGAGGMAHVHRAEVIGEGFHRPVALKRMLPHVAGNLDMVKAFVREAHLASQLRHANVAQTYELGKVEDTYFIAMELIRGRNLREILRQCYATTGSPMPVPVALNILNQICDALDYAHNLCDDRGQPLGIIHRDVSPSNIIVAEGGVVKLIDFGIAKVSAAGMQTMSGTLKGKFGYMAPEYIEGRIDARADLFAVGVIAHELLTNRPLFSTHDDMETLCRVREMEVSPPSRRNPQVPAAVDDIVMTALARDPDRRWQHATALRNAMTTVTARCSLVITSAKAHEWLDWLFDQTNPHAAAAPQGLALDDGEPSIMVEHPDASGNITRIAPRASEPPAPAGTPSRMAAQASIPPEPASSQHEYRAAVARYERHDALVPTGSMLAEDIMPTSIRSSASQINQTIAGTVPARRTPPRTIEPPLRNAQITVEPPVRPSAPRVQASEPAFVGSGTRAPTDVIAPPRRGSPVVTVILVLLAAGLAAGAVYFLLPLVT